MLPGTNASLHCVLTKTTQQMMGFRQKAHSILFDPISGLIDFNDTQKIATTTSLQSAFLNLLSIQHSLNLRKLILVESIPLHEEEDEGHLTDIKAQSIVRCKLCATKADSVESHSHLEVSHRA
jgi:hypothetical protein